MLTIPNILTLIRLIVSPLVLPVLLVYGLPLNIMWLNAVLATLFVLFSLTDFFDGYLARKLQQESAIGKSLDPLADKFLVFSTLIALLAVERIYFYWVVLLIGRDFFMMGLRQIALENNFSVNVSWLGKIKTAVLMVFLTYVIVNPYHGQWLQHPLLNSMELVLLMLTLVLSIVSAQKYYEAFLESYKQKIL